MKKIYVLALSLMMVSFAFSQNARKAVKNEGGVKFTTTSEFASSANKSVTVADYEQNFDGEEANLGEMDFTLINVDGNTVSADWSAIPLLFEDGWMRLYFQGDPNGFAASTSEFATAAQADRWIITPSITIGEDRELNWDARSSGNYAGDATTDEYEVYVTAITAGETPVVADFTGEALLTVSGEEAEWTSHTIDLAAAEFTTGDIYVAFRLISNDAGMLLLDNIVVRPTPVDPVATLDLNAWDAGDIEVNTTTTSTDFTLTNTEVGSLTITSITDLSGTDFSTNLVIADIALATDESHTFTFDYAPTAAGTSTETFTLETNGGNLEITLNGTAHDAYGVMNGDFENVSDFSMAFEGWTMIDGDESTTYGFQSTTFPNEEYTGSFIAFNPSAATPEMTDEAILPHGGEKFGACFAATAGPNNDWLITPKTMLAASANVTLWVKAFTTQYGPEKFNVLVSTTDTDPASFTSVSGGVQDAGDAWEEKTYDLSAYGGQEVYVAIQCTTNDAFIFMVDDISINSTVGINGVNGTELNIFPNPSKGIINVANADNSSIVVYNMVGQVVSTITNAQNFHSIDLSSFENGTYIVKVISENNTITKKVNLIK